MPNLASTLPIWIHASEKANQRAAAFLAYRFFATTGLSVYISAGGGWSLPLEDQSCYHILNDVTDAPSLWSSLDATFNHSVIWIGAPQFGGITKFPNSPNGQIILADFSEQDIPERVFKIFSGHVEKLLQNVDLLYAKSTIVAEKLAKIGIPPSKIQTIGPLQRAQPIPNILGDVAEFDMLKGRPLWTAIGVEPSELPIVLTAHRLVLRENHRMLLILAPATFDQEKEIMTACNELGLRVASRNLDQYPDTTTAVYLADGPDENTRWQTMSPVTFLGKSLTPSLKGTDPFLAAALGSAILYGPYISDFLADYGDLANTGAARIVRDGDSLATAVLQTANPVLAAQMGLAAWEYISQGADATDAVIASTLAHIEGDPGASTQVLE